MSYLAHHPKLGVPSLLACVPPAGVGETAWDILLALYADEARTLSLAQLSALVSAPKSALEGWLGDLEGSALITGAAHRQTGELVAILTDSGRALLDRYLQAATDLQGWAHR